MKKMILFSMVVCFLSCQHEIKVSNMDKIQYFNYLNQLDKKTDSLQLPPFDAPVEKYDTAIMKWQSILKDCQYANKYNDSSINNVDSNIFNKFVLFFKENELKILNNYAFALRRKLSLQYGFEIDVQTKTGIYGYSISFLSEYFSDSNYRNAIYSTYHNKLKFIGFETLSFLSNFQYTNSYTKHGYYYRNVTQPFYQQFILDSPAFLKISNQIKEENNKIW